jgi:hypothetical protein
MRGTRNNRWLFVAMGVTVQMHQAKAWQEGRPTWAIKQDVLELIPKCRWGRGFLVENGG